MRRRFCLALVLAVAGATGGLLARQPAPRSPDNASYTLNVTLDPDSHLLFGRGRVHWRNTSHVNATELRFHLYWNGFRDRRSTWMREAVLEGDDPANGFRADEWGSIELTSLSLLLPSGNQNILGQAQFIAPDDGNADDGTVLRVPLPVPVAPEAGIDLDIGWNAHIPRPIARAGVIGQFFFLAQWFPKLGVLEDDGWNCHQFHAATEFFADFGSYDVSMTVPTGWKVGATGREQSIVQNGNGTSTHRYVEHDVHDFAWTTSPAFLERHARVDVPNLPGIDVRLLLQPGHETQADRHFEAARAALRRYQTWFGPYPYDHLTIVDPVTTIDADSLGSRIAGMEYPTLITAGTDWIEPWGGVDLEDVIVHEIGHQFWYGVVANNEFEHAWMDEGLTTFSAARVLNDAFPGRFVRVTRYFGGLVAWPYQDVRWSPEVDGLGLSGYRLDPSHEVPSTPSWKYWPGEAAAITTYDKTALWLAMLERRIGPATMEKVLSTYYTENSFRHPTPDTFFATASRVAQQDLTWFFDAVYRSSLSFDYSLEQVTEQPVDHGSFDSTVVARRQAAGVFPVDVRVTFDDGASVTERWDGQDQWRAFHYRRAAHVVSAEVDPEHMLLLDINRTNNSWTSTPEAARAGRKWSVRWLGWFEHVLMTYAFFA